MATPNGQPVRETAGCTLRLRPFLPHYAETVAGWVSGDRELFWLAPSTEAPLTAQKVLGWTQERGHPFLLRLQDEDPIGYAELNPLQGRRDYWWVGHVLLAPAWRGQGFGVAFTRLLLEHAFSVLPAERVSLVVFPGNRRAIRSYLQAGFSIQDEQYHQFGRPARSYRMLHLVATRPCPRGKAH